MKTSKIGKQYTSSLRPWLKNVACLSSLISLNEYLSESSSANELGAFADGRGGMGGGLEGVV